MIFRTAQTILTHHTVLLRLHDQIVIAASTTTAATTGASQARLENITAAKIIVINAQIFRQVLDCGGPPPLSGQRHKKRRRAAAIQDAGAFLQNFGK
jgi:hypothetical protein